MGSFVMDDDTLKVLFYFRGADAAKEWQSVNDGVVGGVSDGKFKITDQTTLAFFGTMNWRAELCFGSSPPGAAILP